jgi:HK97 family phage major capsid protein
MDPMSMELNTLLNERASVWENMKSLRSDAAKNTDNAFTGEQRESWDKHEARMTELSGDIERLQGASKYDELEKHVRSVPDQRSESTPDEGKKDEPSAESRYDKAFDTYLRQGMTALDNEQRSTLMNKAYVMGADGESRALSVGTTTAGGYTVPPGFRDVLIETMKAFGNVRAEATNLSTDSGQPLQWPTFNGTAQVGRIIAENVQLTQTDPAFGSSTLGAYMYSSDLVLVPYTFLQDTAIDASSFLARILGTRIARIQNQHFTTGTGSSQPVGIQTNASAGATLATGNTTSITYAGLVNLVHSLDPAYRNGGNAKFMAHDAVIAQFRLLTDTQNRPLWQPAVVAGEPDVILGYPIVVNQDMPVPAASVKSVLFGDFKKYYVVRDVLGIQARRLDERFADFLQVGWFGFARADAVVQDTAAAKALVQSAT